MQQAAKPGLEWAAPPIINRALKTPYATYYFDLCPDGAYWSSFQASNTKRIAFIRTYIFISYNTIICPYITIQLEPDIDANGITENRIKAAGARALYDRFEMFLKATRELTLEPRD